MCACNLAHQPALTFASRSWSTADCMDTPADIAIDAAVVDLTTDESTVDVDQWACAACTFLNPAAASRCHCCTNARTDEYLQLALAADDMSWICQSCTSSNRKTRDVCSICQVGTRKAAEEAVAAVLGKTAPTPASSSKGATPAAATAALTPSHRSSKRVKKGVVEAEASDVDMPDSQSNDDDDQNDDDPMEDIPKPKSARASPASSSRTIVRAKRGSTQAAKLSYPAPYTLPTGGGASPAAGGARGFSPAAALASAFGGFGGFGAKASPPPSAASGASSSSAATPKEKLPCLTNEDSRAELNETQVGPFYVKFAQLMALHRAFTQAKAKEEAKEPSASARQKAAQPNDKVNAIIQSLYDDLKYAPAKASPQADPTLKATACSVCFSEFAPDSSSSSSSIDPDACRPAVMSNCGHASTCVDCFSQYVSIKAKDEAVMPWLCCPSPSCRHPLTPADLVDRAGLSAAQLTHLGLVYMRKRLVRSEAFVSCSTRNCLGGFHAPLPPRGTKASSAAASSAAKKSAMCGVCDTVQTVERGQEGELDDEFKKMIAAGVLRPCPKCKHLTMKEKGVCNVLQCLKCSVWSADQPSLSVCDSRTRGFRRLITELTPVVVSPSPSSSSRSLPFCSRRPRACLCAGGTGARTRPARTRRRSRTRPG